MATTRIIPMHKNKGKSIARCLGDRLDYALNPDKTNGGELVSAFGCNPQIADAEFLYSKHQYQHTTGREQRSDVIAYQMRQSFRPVEVTPEEANRIGCEFAARFLKGNHAFIVATHVDRAHIHNHIIWNSTAVDCRRKFRNFWNSTQAVRKLSDIICVEHGLSIVEAPSRRGMSYNQWQGENAQISHRERLRFAIDDALAKQPSGLDELLRLLQKAGYEIKRGKDIALRGQGDKRFMRLSSLKGNYTQDMLLQILDGKQQHKPRKRPVRATTKPSLLVDIDAKLRAGKGKGYAKWAGNFNLKQMAQTLSYLTEHNLLAYDDLAAATEEAARKFSELSATIKSAEERMAEISVLRTHIINYAKTRDVYVQYRKAGYSKKFLAAHEADIVLHKAAKKAFDDLGVKKLPSVKSLQAEYAELLKTKKAAYTDYRKARDEMRELQIHNANVDMLLGKQPSRAGQREQEQSR